jgi:predicted O-methyltransferase YrrM
VGAQYGVAARDLAGILQTWDEGAWCLAALAVGARAEHSVELTAAAQEVLAAAGVMDSPGGGLLGVSSSTPQQLAGQAAAPLHITSALVSGGRKTWEANSDAALLAQGEASAQAAPMFAQYMLPQMGDLRERLSRPGARMLDVGTGVAAMAVSYARVFPRLHVLGLDVLDRALALASQTIAASKVGDRVSVRNQDVVEFADEDGFDLAWMPAPFLCESAFRAGLPRVTLTLRPGGWLVVGHGKFTGTPMQAAVTRFKTVAYGGTPLDDLQAQQLLDEQGLTSVRTMPTPPGAPAITIGQKPANQ